MKSDFGFKLLGLAAAVFFVAACLPDGPMVEAAPPPYRDLRVGVAVSPSFKKIPEWKSKFERRLAYASKIFEREARIRLKYVLYWNWEPAEEQGSMVRMMEELVNQFPLAEKNVDIMIGLVSLTDISTALNVRDVDVLGLARPFAGYLVLRYPDNPLFRIQEETVLAHELGHIFGAIHTDRPATIMSPQVGRQIPTAFDGENRKIFQITRSFDFKQGTDALNRETVQKLLEAYGRYAETDQPAEFHFSLAIFYLKLGRFEDALKALQAAALADPENPQPRFDLGILLSRMGQPDKARKEIQHAISKMEGPAFDKRRAAAFNVLGGIYFQQENLEGAEYAWRKATKLDPENLDIKTNLASAQIKRGQADAAIDALNEVMAVQGESPRILMNFGSAYFAKKDYARAVRYYEKALELLDRGEGSARGVMPFESVDSSTVLILAGNSYWLMGRKAEALRMFRESCRINDTPECHETLGKMYFNMGEFASAIPELALVLRTKKNSPDLYGIMSVALHRTGKIQEAMAILNEGISMTSDRGKRSVLYQNLGYFYLQQQQPEPALSQFQLAVNDDWRNTGAHYGLAVAYLARGDTYNAQQSLRTLLSIDPKHADAGALFEKVKEEGIQLEIRRRGAAG